MHKNWDIDYGKGNWRLVWKWGEIFLDFLGVCAICEDAYYFFLLNNSEIFKRLINSASDVYYNNESDVESGFDYTKQGRKTRFHDIAIRRVLIRREQWFKGSELIRIHGRKGTHPLSKILAPENVPFHRPDLIEKPEFHQIQGIEPNENKFWWYRHPGSIVSFYQKNRYLQKRGGV